MDHWNHFFNFLKIAQPPPPLGTLLLYHCSIKNVLGPHEALSRLRPVFPLHVSSMTEVGPTGLSFGSFLRSSEFGACSTRTSYCAQPGYRYKRLISRPSSIPEYNKPSMTSNFNRFPLLAGATLTHLRIPLRSRRLWLRRVIDVLIDSATLDHAVVNLSRFCGDANYYASRGCHGFFRDFLTRSIQWGFDGTRGRIRFRTRTGYAHIVPSHFSGERNIPIDLDEFEISDQQQCW